MTTLPDHPMATQRRLQLARKLLTLLGTSVLAWAALPAAAQVYKWVDEQGRTHYGQSKVQAGQSSTTQLQVGRSPAGAGSDAVAVKRPVPQGHREAFDPRPTPTNDARPTAPRPAPSMSGGREDGSDASRCALARDVLSGSVRHGNGKPTDQHDIAVANSDVKLFCR